MSEEVPMPMTICRDCIFAIWEDNEQIGCQFDRIEKFEENGAEIIGQDDGIKRYFLIHGRFCTACRNEDWGKKYARRRWIREVEDFIKLKVDVIIRVFDDHTIDDIKKTMESAINQRLKPLSVMIVIDPDYNQTETIDIVDSIRYESRIPWRVESIPIEKAARIGKGSYYAVFNAGYEIPFTFLDSINKAINEDMKQFVVILGDSEGNGLVMQNCGLTFEQFIDMGEKTNTEYQIKNIEEIL